MLSQASRPALRQQQLQMQMPHSKRQALAPALVQLRRALLLPKVLRQMPRLCTAAAQL